MLQALKKQSEEKKLRKSSLPVEDDELFKKGSVKQKAELFTPLDDENEYETQLKIPKETSMFCIEANIIGEEKELNDNKSESNREKTSQFKRFYDLDKIEIEHKKGLSKRSSDKNDDTDEEGVIMRPTVRKSYVFEDVKNSKRPCLRMFERLMRDHTAFDVIEDEKVGDIRLNTDRNYSRIEVNEYGEMLGLKNIDEGSLERNTGDDPNDWDYNPFRFIPKWIKVSLLCGSAILISYKIFAIRKNN